jgi:hypothetical protein
MLLRIEAAMPAEVIGAAGRRPGTQVDAVHLWSLANIFLHGRQILALLGKITPAHEPERTAVVLDFWRRAAGAFRDDGHLQAWDAGGYVRPYGGDVIEAALTAATPVTDEAWPMTKKLNAALVSYLFLLYFDTRAGMSDTGPYELGDGRVLLLREFTVRTFPWAPVASVPSVVGAFVLDGVEVRVNDWGTSVTEPANYLDHVVAAGFLDPHTLEGVEPSAGWLSAVRTARNDLYRRVAGMSRAERVDAGAHVYFTFLRPFAEVAGIADDLDWDVPKESLDVYEWLEPYEGSGAPPEDTGPYYEPVPA